MRNELHLTGLKNRIILERKQATPSGGIMRLGVVTIVLLLSSVLLPVQSTLCSSRQVQQIRGTDLVGDTVTIGTTWYENQHNGTVGRMLEKDDSGYVHFAWTNGLDETSSVRHVYYNFVDPNGTQGWPGTGVQVDASSRAGFVTLDVDFGGVAFPAFHEVTTSPNNNAHAAVGFDCFPHMGAFVVTEAPWMYEAGIDLEVIWPRIQIDRNHVIHLVAIENPYW